jgi:hypothetical protein
VTDTSNSKARAGGIGCWGFGSALAIAISWSEHHSIVWSLIDGFLSWFYILYFAVTRAA